MKKYTNYCTELQTKRAYKLGAPIESGKRHGKNVVQINSDEFLEIPTAEQMQGWLREKGLFIQTGVGGRKHQFQIDKLVHGDFRYLPSPFVNYDTHEQAILAAIDAALDYLEKGGNNDNN